MSQSDPNQPPSEIPLASLVNPDHPLIKLASALNWDYFEAEFTQPIGETAGRPALPTRGAGGIALSQSDVQRK